MVVTAVSVVMGITLLLGQQEPREQNLEDPCSAPAPPGERLLQNSPTSL